MTAESCQICEVVTLVTNGKKCDVSPESLRLALLSVAAVVASGGLKHVCAECVTHGESLLATSH